MKKPAPNTRAATRRGTGARRAATDRSPTASLDLVCCRVSQGRLAVLRKKNLAPSASGKARRGAKGLGTKGLGTKGLGTKGLGTKGLGTTPRATTRNSGSELPWITLDASAATSLDMVGARLARTSLGDAPSWIGQLGAFNNGDAHPSGAPLSVAYLAVVPVGTDAPADTAWMPADSHAGLTARQRAMVEAALVVLRERMDIAPIAFRMLPGVFTLSELQEVYELLLGRRLHKASFRRALQGADIVAPTDEWRSEGRGRPAQLFRYAPRKRKREVGALRRPVRFELLG